MSLSYVLADRRDICELGRVDAAHTCSLNGCLSDARHARELSLGVRVPNRVVVRCAPCREPRDRGPDVLTIEQHLGRTPCRSSSAVWRRRKPLAEARASWRG